MGNVARPQPDRAAQSILSLIKQVQYKAFVRLESVFQPLGVTAVQFRILTTLSSRPGLSSADLARLYGVKPQTIIKQIALIEAKGLIERRISSANKRLLELSLTEAGKTCLDQCQKGTRALERTLLEPLESNEQELLRNMLLKLQNSMSNSTRHGDGESSIEELTQEYRRPGVQRA
jgi:DNA-binding MarR family transcriptional regulator